MCDNIRLVKLSCLSIIVILTIFIYKSTVKNENISIDISEDASTNASTNASTTDDVDNSIEHSDSDEALITDLIEDDEDSNEDSNGEKSELNLRQVFRAGGCILPPHSSSGSWSILHTSANETIGSFVPKGTILRINCDPSYKLDSSINIAVCLSGQWTPPIGKCLKTCPSLVSQSVLKVTCSYKNSESDDCADPFDGTQAQFSCGNFYKDIRRNRRKVFCNDGKWSEDVTECVPVCGQANINPTLIVNGGDIEKGDFPWQVALYNLLEDSGYQRLICGGSVLSERIIVTAAHCVTDDEGRAQPPLLYTVAVGKYYREFDDTRDYEETQFSSVLDIIIHETYRGYHQNFLGDIALLVTYDTLVFSARVQPVCVDWEEAYKDEVLEAKSSRVGQVSGWGYTVEDRRPSNVLKNLSVPLIPTEKCEKELPFKFLDYLTHDKICAGYLNKSTSVCRGDSGGGLVLKLGVKYYILGIVSVSPGNDAHSGCNSNQYALYTQIYKYMDEFLLPKVIYDPKPADPDLGYDVDEVPHKVDDIIPDLGPDGPTEPCNQDNSFCMKGGCFLPGKPYIISGTGPEVANGTVTNYQCDDNFKFHGGSPTVTCIDGIWTPQMICLATCPPLHNTSTVSVNCKYDSRALENCEDAVHGTVAKYKCAPFYESKFIANFPVYCWNGEWSAEIPECIPICGQRAKSSSIQGAYPWHIAIYNTTNRDFICSGTLLSEKIVITVAHCVTNEKGILSPVEHITVAAGKFYKRYNDRRDRHLTQFSSVDEIFTPRQYEGYLKNYFSDIALIVTKKPFKLSPRVQPVCVDWNKEYESLVLSPRQNSNPFFVSGWGHQIEGAKPLEQASPSEVALFPRDECSVRRLKDFNVYMTEDKICSLGLSNSECRTYAGTGLVFEQEERFYLAGVLSISSQNLEELFPCGQYHFFTQTYYHLDNFILKKWV